MENNTNNSSKNYELVPKLLSQVEKVIIGKTNVVKMLIAAL